MAGKIRVEIDDVLQGGLGDCWLMSIFAAVAYVAPERIKNVFIDKFTMTRCSYPEALRMQLFIDGTWQQISVPNKFPADCEDMHEFQESKSTTRSPAHHPAAYLHVGRAGVTHVPNAFL